MFKLGHQYTQMEHRNELRTSIEESRRVIFTDEMSYLLSRHFDQYTFRNISFTLLSKVDVVGIFLENQCKKILTIDFDIEEKVDDNYEFIKYYVYKWPESFAKYIYLGAFFQFCERQPVSQNISGQYLYRIPIFPVFTDEKYEYFGNITWEADVIFKRMDI